jgi:hypothetical protein
VDEWQYEMAQRRETEERAARVAEIQELAKRRFTPYMLDGEPCCPDCLEPLPAHRVEVGICVRCLTEREQRERMNGR